jgi:non-ribosomal peptide synthetase component F
VAGFLERSPEFIITLLAVLKAGAAYLPQSRRTSRRKATIAP